MSEAPQVSAVPQWTLGDRLRKAREHAGLSQAELAREIGIGRTSLTHYETGKKVAPKTAILAWAFRTGVPIGWLATGENAPAGPGPGTSSQFDHRGSQRSLQPRKYGKFALISPSPLTTGIAA